MSKMLKTRLENVIKFNENQRKPKKTIRKTKGKRERGAPWGAWGPRGGPGAPPHSLFFCFPNDFLSFSLIFIDFDNMFKSIFEHLGNSSKIQEMSGKTGKQTGKTGRFPYMVVSLCVFPVPTPGSLV